MEHYSQYPFASMAMREDAVLRGALTKLIAAEGIDIAIETGTFLGMGSTKFTAECFLQVAPPKRFVTIELNFSNWCQAKVNLRPYPFIDCRWAASVATETAINFINNDEMLRDHRNYHGIYIDDIDNPVAWYTRELIPDAKINQETKAVLWDGEDFLPRSLQVHAAHRPLVTLDSAGGIGLLEFQTLLQHMGDREFFLLLDDTHHIKHYRSLQHVSNSPDFNIVAKGESWALASHRGAGKKGG